MSPTPPQVDGITLDFPGKRTTVRELIAFEPSDSSVGIFGNYIEVQDMNGRNWILDDGTKWIHPFNEADEPDYQTIAGTYRGDIFPEPSAKLTPRKILGAIGFSTRFLDYHCAKLNESIEERLGINLDTELFY